MPTLALDDLVGEGVADDLADHVLVGDDDLFVVLRGEDSGGQFDLVDHAVDPFDRDGIADHEGPGQDDGDAGAVVGERPLQGEAAAEGQGARGRR